MANNTPSTPSKNPPKDNVTGEDTTIPGTPPPRPTQKDDEKKVTTVAKPSPMPAVGNYSPSFVS